MGILAGIAAAGGLAYLGFQRLMPRQIAFPRPGVAASGGAGAYQRANLDEL